MRPLIVYDPFLRWWYLPNWCTVVCKWSMWVSEWWCSSVCLEEWSLKDWLRVECWWVNSFKDWCWSCSVTNKWFRYDWSMSNNGLLDWSHNWWNNWSSAVNNAWRVSWYTGWNAANDWTNMFLCERKVHLVLLIDWFGISVWIQVWIMCVNIPERTKSGAGWTIVLVMSGASTIGAAWTSGSCKKPGLAAAKATIADKTIWKKIERKNRLYNHRLERQHSD